jgi:hypothetical protein
MRSIFKKAKPRLPKTPISRTGYDRGAADGAVCLRHLGEVNPPRIGAVEPAIAVLEINDHPNCPLPNRPTFLIVGIRDNLQRGNQINLIIQQKTKIALGVSLRRIPQA